MARGRKSRITGWGLLALALVIAGLLGWSGKYHWVLSVLRGKAVTGTSYSVAISHGVFMIWSVTPPEISNHNRTTLSSRTKYQLDWWFSPHEYALPIPGQRQSGWGLFWLYACDAPLKSRAITILLWPIALAAFSGAAAPMVWSWRQTRSRIKRGLCPACAYNLAGLDVEAPCPECGTVRRGTKAAVK